MAKNLIIVESPAKTRTLKKFLGRQYAVEASVGHIRDLAKKDLGIGPDYEPHYVTLADKKDVVKKLKEAAAKADMVYLAPDPDREGEAIAWHIARGPGQGRQADRAASPSTRSPRRRCSRRSSIRARSTSTWSTRSRRGESSTA